MAAPRSTSLPRPPKSRSLWPQRRPRGETCGSQAGRPREFLRVGLIDELHVAIAPILLGGGVRLWDELRGLEDSYRVTTEVAESGTVHMTFTRSNNGPRLPDPWRPDG